MEFRRSIFHPSVVAIPLGVLAIALMIAAAVLHAAKVEADVANARLLLVTAQIAYADPSHPAPLTEYLPILPSPAAHGAKRRFAVYRLDGAFAVYALEDDATGWRYDPASASFGSAPVPIGTEGTAIVS